METIIVLLIIIDFLELGFIICAFKKCAALAAEKKPAPEIETEEDDDEMGKAYLRSIEGIMSYDPYK